MLPKDSFCDCFNFMKLTEPQSQDRVKYLGLCHFQDQGEAEQLDFSFESRINHKLQILKSRVPSASYLHKYTTGN